MAKINRQEVYDKYGGKCAYTGKPLGDDWQVDHMVSKYHHANSVYLNWTHLDEIPAKLEEVHHIDNLVPACRIINHYKRSLDLEGFRRYMLRFHERLAKLPKNTNVPATQRRKEYLYKVAELFDITPDKPFGGTFYFEKLKQQQ